MRRSPTFFVNLQIVFARLEKVGDLNWFAMLNFCVDSNGIMRFT